MLLCAHASGRCAGPPCSRRHSNPPGKFCRKLEVESKPALRPCRANRVNCGSECKHNGWGRCFNHSSPKCVKAVIRTEARSRTGLGQLPECSSSALRISAIRHSGNLSLHSQRYGRGTGIAGAAASDDPGIGSGSDSGSGNRGGAGGSRSQTGQADDDSNDSNKDNHSSSNSSSSAGPLVSGVLQLLPTPVGSAVAAAVVLLGILVALIRQNCVAAEVQATLHLHQDKLKQLSATIGVGDASLNIWQSIAAVKRLLREVFADQLAIKQRLDKLESSTATELEAADDYQLAVLGMNSSAINSQGRSPVRITGGFMATGLLPWSQEPSSADALSSLQALGPSGELAGHIQLHSVLAGGKRRVTAELGPAEASDGTPMMQLYKLLYRVRIKDKLHLLIAPLGGSLDAIGRRLTPVTGEYGCTHALRRGHGLSVFDSKGSGKAACIVQGNVSAAAGFFVEGTCKTSMAQLQARTQDGLSLSVVAARHRPRHHHSIDSSKEPPPGMRFLGAQAPGTRIHTKSSSHAKAQTVFGAVGVVPVRDLATATLWAEKSSAGVSSWGTGLYSRPDPDGVEMGMMLGRRPTCQADRSDARSGRLFCELTAKVPVGDGLSISPGAVVLCGSSSNPITLGYSMQSSWRF